jgi:multiple sugar transport system substrate-binding protein
MVVVNSVLSKGQTPYALNFNATYNDAQSPWTAALESALFGDHIPQALRQGQSAITGSLGDG